MHFRGYIIGTAHEKKSCGRWRDPRTHAVPNEKLTRPRLAPPTASLPVPFHELSFHQARGARRDREKKINLDNPGGTVRTEINRNRPFFFSGFFPPPFRRRLFFRQVVAAQSFDLWRYLFESEADVTSSRQRKGRAGVCVCVARDGNSLSLLLFPTYRRGHANLLCY